MSVLEIQDVYAGRFDRFMAGRAGSEPSWLTARRQVALQRFRLAGFPTTRDEEWRFTPIGPLLETPFRAADEVLVNLSRADIEPFTIEGVTTLLVFVNGRFAPALSSTAAASGVTVSSLATQLRTDPGAIDRALSRSGASDKLAFTALNTAFMDDGAVVRIPANVTLDEPVHVLYFSSASDPVVTHPRTIVVAEANSSATVVETYAGPDGAQYFTNAVTEIIGGPGSRLEHYRVQRESLEAFHISSTWVNLERSAVYVQQSFTFGGRIVRNDVNARLDDEGIECTLNGLYLGHRDRLIDNHTVIDHARPHCNSHEIYRGMLTDRSRGVFNGKIFVRQDAQKTDAKQTNQVLLLSDDATINTKPQLEIFADDVKCTHGATVGQIDAEALFYLRARGIGQDEARAMLVHAFASEIIDRVRIAPLRDALERTLLGYLPS